MLVVVCGLPGAGKSTVSRRVADRLDGRLMRTDVVRKELFPDPSYSTAESRATYDAVLERARERVRVDEHVVLDGTFRRRTLRERAAAVADDAGVAFRLVRVVCEDRQVRERIRARVGDESDADVAVYEQLRGEFEPIERDHAVVDNSGSLAETTARVDDLFDPVASE